MAMPTRYITFLNESLQKQQKYYPAVSLSSQKIYAEKSQQKYFCWLVQTYILWLQIKLFVHMLP